MRSNRLGIRKKQGKKICRFQLEGNIDISQAAGFKEELMASLDRGDEIRFVFEKATQLDVTAVQLLWAASREAQHRKARVGFEGEVPRPILFELSAAGFAQFPVSQIRK
jgi:anti-anti-sigma regulatory factor